MSNPWTSIERGFRSEMEKVGIWPAIGRAALTAVPAVAEGVVSAFSKKKKTPKPKKAPGVVRTT